MKRRIKLIGTTRKLVKEAKTEMNDKELYKQILGIVAPWEVSDVAIKPIRLRSQSKHNLQLKKRHLSRVWSRVHHS